MSAVCVDWGTAPQWITAVGAFTALAAFLTAQRDRIRIPARSVTIGKATLDNVNVAVPVTNDYGHPISTVTIRVDVALWPERAGSDLPKTFTQSQSRVAPGGISDRIKLGPPVNTKAPFLDEAVKTVTVEFTDIYSRRWRIVDNGLPKRIDQRWRRLLRRTSRSGT